MLEKCWGMDGLVGRVHWGKGMGEGWPGRCYVTRPLHSADRRNSCLALSYLALPCLVGISLPTLAFLSPHMMMMKASGFEIRNDTVLSLGLQFYGVGVERRMAGRQDDWVDRDRGGHPF